MNTKGFVKVPRALMEREWFSNHNARNLFFQLLLTANFTDDGKVGRGQVATSYAQLSAETGLSAQQLRTAIDLLSKGGMITKTTTKKSTRSGMVITVCNYDSYQGQATAQQQKEQQKEQHGGQEERKWTKKEEYKEEVFEEERGDRESLALTPPNSLQTASYLGYRYLHRSFTKTEANLNALAKLRELETTPYDMPPEDMFD